MQDYPAFISQFGKSRKVWEAYRSDLWATRFSRQKIHRPLFSTRMIRFHMAGPKTYLLTSMLQHNWFLPSTQMSALSQLLCLFFELLIGVVSAFISPSFARGYLILEHLNCPLVNLSLLFKRANSILKQADVVSLRQCFKTKKTITKTIHATCAPAGGGCWSRSVGAGQRAI